VVQVFKYHNMREQYSHITLIKKQDQKTQYSFAYIKWQIYTYFLAPYLQKNSMPHLITR